MTVMVTGGAGFIGSNFISHFLASHPEANIINLDKLTYAGNLENLTSVANDPRYSFVRGDICDAFVVKELLDRHPVDVIVNFAAESHVDRSILGPGEFVQTNVMGTLVLLEAAKKCGVRRFLQVSTDEVYGSLGETGLFTEWTPLHPNSPYSASKTAADHLCQAYHHTFGMDIVITRCSNNYGPFQFPEKLIPLMILNALRGKSLPVYGDGKNVRDWLHVSDHCRAIDTVMHNGISGQVYNVGGNNEWKNIDIVKLILKLMGKPESLITYVKDRPGHDLRYAIDASKITRELGWSPAYTFERGIRETIDWYLAQEGWWGRIINGEYQNYYKTMYERR